MDAPAGMSMFAGAGSLHLNSSAQERLDEQEELEDQERRKKELAANLANAFDDLVDDDEPSSVNSSHDLEASRLRIQSRLAPATDPTKIHNPPTYIESLSHLKETPYDMARPHEPMQNYACYSDPSKDPRLRYSPCGGGDAEENVYYPNEYGGHLGGQHNGVNSYEAKQQMLNFEQLKMMYEMRVKECQQMAEQLAEAEARAETEADSLRSRLAAAVTERDQANLALQQSQRLLATTKHQVSELQQAACAERERAALELHSTALALQDAQQRLQSVQVARTHDTDRLFREQQDRHREECERLRDNLENVKSRLADKEQELLAMTRKCTEVERSKDELVVEKGSVVNRLAAELEAAQSRLAGGDATAQRAQLQVKELGTKLEITAQELVASRKECSRVRHEFDEWRNNLQQMLRDVLRDQSYAGGSPKSPGWLSALKDVLSRYKHHEQEINELTDKIDTRESKLEASRLLEKELRKELEERRTAEAMLSSKVTTLQKQLETVQSDYTELETQHKELLSRRKSLERSDAELLCSLERLNAQHADSLRENGELKSLYLQVCSARDGLSRELQDIRTKLKTLQKEKDAACDRESTISEQLEKEREEAHRLAKEVEKRKQEFEDVTGKMEEQQKEYINKQKELADKLYQYIKQENVAASKSLDMCVECEQRGRTIAQLEAQVQQYIIKFESQECNELLLKELRSKAEYFEKYIVERFRKLQEQRHVSTNTEPDMSAHRQREEDRGESVTDMLVSKTDMMMMEKQIREQLADTYMLEIKTTETNCNKKINELQKENSATISKLKDLLETKASEIDVLKKFIISERNKITEILQAKDSQLSSLVQENRQLQEEYRELREKTTEMKQMLEKSHHKNGRLKADLEKKSAEVQKEKDRATRALADMAEQLRNLDAKTAHVETQHDQLKDKYRNVKKTALVYKEYAAKKDAHVESELERIKCHYEQEVARLHEKLQRLVKKRREIQVNEHINKMQSDFDAVVSEVNSVT